jgi:hypothetical protein
MENDDKGRSVHFLTGYKGKVQQNERNTEKKV